MPFSPWPEAVAVIAGGVVGIVAAVAIRRFLAEWSKGAERSPSRAAGAARHSQNDVNSPPASTDLLTPRNPPGPGWHLRTGIAVLVVVAVATVFEPPGSGIGEEAGRDQHQATPMHLVAKVAEFAVIGFGAANVALGISGMRQETATDLNVR